MYPSETSGPGVHRAAPSAPAASAANAETEGQTLGPGIQAEDEARAMPGPQAGGGTALAIAGEIVQTVVLALVLFLIIRNFIQNYRVENISMEPNFHEGQFLIINRFAYCPGFHLDVVPLNVHAEKMWCLWTPSRGDVVVFHYPPDPTKDFIKRVIALPGETVEVKMGRVYINGKIMSEPFGPNPGTYNSPPLTLAAGQIYVLGDNRDSSSDSHVWGPVPMQDVVGRAVVRYWPPSKWSIVPHWSFPELGGTAG